jgi:hypothetical protein
MKLRLEFTSGIPSREVETSSTVEEFLFAEFGTRLNFENLGGRVIIVEAQEAPAVEEVAPAPKPKRKAKQEE